MTSSGQNQGRIPPLAQCNQHLKAVNTQLSTTLKVYYNEVIGSRIPPDIFMAYIQGFYGWVAGEILDGKYTEYDGLSGRHLVIFNLLDVFLGLDIFIDEAKFENYITFRTGGIHCFCQEMLVLG